jgi:hypothetical protein
MTQIAAWIPCGELTENASITTSTNPQALSGEDTGLPLNARVCNRGAVSIIVAFGDSTVDATTDTRRVEVLPGAERVFSVPNGATHADMVTVSGTSSGSVQLGMGV